MIWASLIAGGITALILALAIAGIIRVNRGA